MMDRRRVLGALACAPLAAPAAATPLARPGDTPRATAAAADRLAAFSVGQPATVDISSQIVRYTPGITRLRLRADVTEARRAAADAKTFVDAATQYPEFRLVSPRLSFTGAPAGALRAGASAVRVQIESTDTDFDDPAAVTTSGILRIEVDAPLAKIKHGLESWHSFDALTRSVQGGAPAGSSPRGRTDLIGAIFEITPGMFSEGVNGSGGSGRVPAPVATIRFPCTLRAMDAGDRPVFRSVSGRRDIIQVEALPFAPIDGQVVLQDLVIRDNRAWYNSGEAGVRIKDRFAGRSVHIERCEFVRCQNAVAGSGNVLRILDCRIVDCGLGDQAHSLYVQPQLLEFYGNVVTFSADNRFARAHMVKTRALRSRILGNHISMNDAAVSYLIDLSNGGDCEIGGNLLHHGRRSDNTGATLVAYAPEGAASDTGRQPPAFASGRSFQLVARNNTLISDFAARTHFFVVDDHLASRAEGGTTHSFPEPLVIADNVYWAAGEHALLTRRDRQARPPRVSDLSPGHTDNTRADQRPRTDGHATGSGAPAPRNTAGAYAARRFTGHTHLGTGSEPYVYAHRGAA